MSEHKFIQHAPRNKISLFRYSYHHLHVNQEKVLMHARAIFCLLIHTVTIMSIKKGLDVTSSQLSNRSFMQSSSCKSRQHLDASYCKFALDILRRKVNQQRCDARCTSFLPFQPLFAHLKDSCDANFVFWCHVRRLNILAHPFMSSTAFCS